MRSPLRQGACETHRDDAGRTEREYVSSIIDRVCPQCGGNMMDFECCGPVRQMLTLEVAVGMQRYEKAWRRRNKRHRVRALVTETQLHTLDFQKELS